MRNCLCVPLTGNVLNSGGSVIPLFKDQIANNHKSGIDFLTG